MQDWLVPVERIMRQLEAMPEGKRFHYPIRHGSMRVGVYAPTPPHDPQSPHDQDELYIVIAGSGRFVKGGEQRGVRTGRRDFRRGGRAAPLRGIRPGFRDLGRVLGATGWRGRERMTLRQRHASPRPAATGITLPSPTWLVDRILYRDALVLIIDKPAGVPVHAGPGGGVNLEHYFEALRFGLPQLPGLGHRLDRDTSGCLVLGRHRKALSRLGRLFAGGQVEKVYWAVVRGAPPQPAGRIELALKKRSEQRGWWMQADPEGQAAVTDYRVLGQADGLTWLECRPRTGRTHQIRVHCAELGCPVLGDPIYGAPGHRRWRAAVAPACARDQPAALSEPPTGRRCRPTAVAYGGGAAPMRLWCTHGAAPVVGGQRRKRRHPKGKRSMFGLIISLVVAGIAGWIAGNIMKAQPIVIGNSPIIGNVILGVIGGFVGSRMLWVIGLGASGLIGSLIAAVLGAIVVIYVDRLLQEAISDAAASSRRQHRSRPQTTLPSLLVVVTGVGVVSSSFRPALKFLMPLARSPATRGSLPAPNTMTTTSKTMIQCQPLEKPMTALQKERAPYLVHDPGHANLDLGRMTLPDVPAASVAPGRERCR